MKLALYRKYRPTRFADVVGQENVTAALKNQLAAGRFGHAYIFTGVRGTGKTSLAKIIAKAVNCPNSVDGEPCGECEICRGIDSGAILDVTEMDAASNNRVDDIRQLLEESNYAPAVCKKRVYIIDEVHMLSASAFNALLKTLEEPPAHVLFLLATTEIQKVPATILSRCQRFELKRIPQQKIAARLKYVAECEGIDLTDGAANLISRLADGALRDALSILDTAASLGGSVDEQTVRRMAGVSDKEYLFTLANAISRGDVTDTLATVNKIYSSSVEPQRLLGELIRHYRNLLMVCVGGVTLKDCSESMQQRYELESKSIDEQQLLYNLSVLGEASDRMTRTLDREITFELAVIKLAGGDGRPAAAKAARPAAATAPAPVREAAVSAAPAAEVYVGAEPAERRQESENHAEAAKLQPTESSEGLLREWDEVVAGIRQKNRTFGALLAHSKAHLTESHLLIEANDMAIKFIRDNAGSRQLIKQTVFDVTGLKLPVGPWKGDKAAEKPQSDSLTELEAFVRKAGEAGAEIDIK